MSEVMNRVIGIFNAKDLTECSSPTDEMSSVSSNADADVRGTTKQKRQSRKPTAVSIALPSAKSTVNGRPESKRPSLTKTTLTLNKYEFGTVRDKSGSVSIDISQKPDARTLKPGTINHKHVKTSPAALQDIFVVPEAKQGAEEDDEHPELTNLDLMLNDSLALSYFKRFLQSKLKLELLLFWQDCQLYGTRTRQHARKLYELFVKEGSPSHVKPSVVHSQFIELGMADPTAGLFEPAQKDTLAALKEVHAEFNDSAICDAYLRAKKADKVATMRSSYVFRDDET
jgi:hypothetical protein